MLIAQAGSAERAIQKLVIEKRAQARKIERIWDLIEKQKTMVIGLNKDYEKVSKEKEKYRKKLKEYQIAAVAAPPHPPVPTSTTGERKALDQKVASSNHDRIIESTIVAVGAGNNGSQAASPRSPTSVSHSARLLKGQGALLPEVDRASPLQSHPANPQKEPTSPQTLSSSSTLQGQENQSPITPKAHKSKPSWSSTGEKSRKPAPAPLDLSQASPSKVDESAVDAEDGDSEYEYETDADGLPLFERGRRKTRAEDDRQREVIAITEERRSKSTKSSKSKSKGKPIDEQMETKPDESVKALPDDAELPAGMIPGVGLPSSPRANLLGGLQSPLQQSMGSIASAMAPSKSALPQTARLAEAQTVALRAKSPGLPMSPRPGDRPANSAAPRMPATGFTTPGPGPASPRSGMPLSPRAPKHPIPLPKSATVAAFPPVLPADSSNTFSFQTTSMAERLQPGYAEVSHSKLAPIEVNAPPTPTVYKGYMTDQYPGLLLPPNALPLIDVRVFSSRLTPSRASFQSFKSGEDDPHFTLAIHARSDNKQLWRVEKTVHGLSKLDQHVRKAINFRGAFPDRSLFSGHAPAKVDARRAALHQYFEELLDTPMDETEALIVCDFFSQHVIEPGDSSSPTPNDTDSGISVPASPKLMARKEGWLSKKGKQFGGWKERYFILDSSEMRHYESPTGQALGIIKLHTATISRPSGNPAEEDPEYRHAFMIMEPKRRDSTNYVRHVLCAESDEERDGWVEALLQHIGQTEAKESPIQPSGSIRSPSFSSKGSEANKIRKRNPETVENPPTKVFHSLSYEETVASRAPTLGTPSRPTGEFPVDEAVEDEPPSNHPTISGPVAGGPIQNVASWGNKDARKRSMFGLLNRSQDDSVIGISKSGRGVSPRPPHPERQSPMRMVFGVPLQEALEFARPVGVDVCLPAIVYRCIEYLEANDGALEEGIFRVPGSSTVISRLKDRFNTEGDLKLLEGPHVDIHAVASLLKAYLRELPESILTKEHHHDFAKVCGKCNFTLGRRSEGFADDQAELENKHQKIAVINMLLHKLPECNWELLASLSRYLMMVVDNQEVNKMNLRNGEPQLVLRPAPIHDPHHALLDSFADLTTVCIVIAPTLNIPNPLISLFITEHQSIFKPEPYDQTTASLVLESLSDHSVSPPPAPPIDDIRSPRKSAFTDVSTPSYNQTTFSNLGAALTQQNTAQSRSIDQQLRSAANNACSGTGAGAAPAGGSNTFPFPSDPKSPPASQPSHGIPQRNPSKKTSLDQADAAPAPANRTRHIVGQHARERESPSPASRGQQHQHQQHVQPPHPGYGKLVASASAPAMHISQQQVQAAPGEGYGSLNATMMQGSGAPAATRRRDSPGSADAGSAGAASRRARRESAMLGSGLSGGVLDVGVSGEGQQVRHKSSYTRLREGAGGGGMRGVREE